jgi:DNA-directed RNA polymerase specialized sigma24 family protein
MDLKGIDWISISQRLTKYALACIRGSSLADAEDLAQKAIAQLFDDGYEPWDPAKYPDVFDHLTSVVRGLVSNRRRKRKRQKTDPIEKEYEDDEEERREREELRSNAPGPEERMRDRELAERAVEGAEAAFANDLPALALLECYQEGIDLPADQSARTGYDVDTLKNAGKRLKRKLDEIRSALESEHAGEAS